MRTRIILSILLFTTTNPVFCEKGIKDIVFSLIVADCFHDDTISITLGHCELVKSMIVKSDFSTGLTNLTIFQDGSSLWVVNANTKNKFENLILGKFLEVSIVVNNTMLKETINLWKGRTMVLDFCYQEMDDGSRKKRLRITQHNKQVKFY